MYVMIMCPLTLFMTLDCSLELVMVSLYVFVPRCYGIVNKSPYIHFIPWYYVWMCSSFSRCVILHTYFMLKNCFSQDLLKREIVLFFIFELTSFC